MSWVLLVIAGLFEVAFAFCLGKAKEAIGSTMLLWYGGFLISISISMGLLIKVTQKLPIGTAYAVWTGIGAVGTVLIGIIIFDDFNPFYCWLKSSFVIWSNYFKFVIPALFFYIL